MFYYTFAAAAVGIRPEVRFCALRLCCCNSVLHARCRGQFPRTYRKLDDAGHCYAAVDDVHAAGCGCGCAAAGCGCADLTGCDDEDAAAGVAAGGRVPKQS